MRCDQFAGLPSDAGLFLRENEIPGATCPTCAHNPGPRLEKCGTFEGMFDDEYPLMRHFLTEDRIAEEFLQCAPWSSGPVHFLGLRVYKVEDDKTLTILREFLWDPSEIAEQS